MNLEQWVGVTTGIVSLIGAFAISVRHLVKHYLAELKPNGGSSIKDKVKDIDDKVDKLELRIDDIYKLLIDRA